MKFVKVAVAFLLIESLSVSTVLEALAQRELSQETDAGKVVVISERVGETIDLEERNYYGIFLGALNFHSAIIFQLPDSSYVAEITEEQDGDKQIRTMPIDQKTLDQLRELIDTAVGPAPTVKRRFPAQLRHPKTIIQQQIAVKKAEEQAQILMKEKWTKERWREESSYDRGLNYRASGAMLGFTLGAAAGMLIGKGFQGKKVERSVHHPAGEWGGEAWTEEYYSYKRKDAPYWGAGIGGLAGAVTGYFLSKRSDKEYYILVPRHIRTEKSGLKLRSACLGFSLWGCLMGTVAGYALHAPSVGRKGENFDGGHFVGGYLAGSALGTIFMAGYDGRAQHKKLWEESLLTERPKSSLDVRFVPWDRYALSLQPRRSPSGETFCECRLHLVRVLF